MNSCIGSFNLNCMMQLKQFYNIATKVSSRKKCYYFWWSTWLVSEYYNTKYGAVAIWYHRTTPIKLGGITLYKHLMANVIRHISLWLHIDGILPKGPYLPCIGMAGKALLAGYPRYMVTCAASVLATSRLIHCFNSVIIYISLALDESYDYYCLATKGLF